MTERRPDERDILVVYIDGIVFGDYRAVASIGVDTGSSKHVLRLREGASENKIIAKKMAQWLEQEYPSVVTTIREGLDEMFTINESMFPPILSRSLGSTNIIDSCFIGTRG